MGSYLHKLESKPRTISTQRLFMNRIDYLSSSNTRWYGQCFICFTRLVPRNILSIALLLIDLTHGVFPSMSVCLLILLLVPRYIILYSHLWICFCIRIYMLQGFCSVKVICELEFVIFEIQCFLSIVCGVSIFF